MIGFNDAIRELCKDERFRSTALQQAAELFLAGESGPAHAIVDSYSKEQTEEKISKVKKRKGKYNGPGHPESKVREICILIEGGFTNAQIKDLTGIPHKTVYDIRVKKAHRAISQEYNF